MAQNSNQENLIELQIKQQKYQNECFEIRGELYSITSNFDIEEYNERCSELYNEIFGKEDYILKTKNDIFHELCTDFARLIIKENIQEDRNLLYTRICNYIGNFNLSDENIDEEFQYEKKPVLDTFQKWKDRIDNNKACDQRIRAKVHTHDVYSIPKTNKNPKVKDFVPVSITKPWGLDDLVEKVYDHSLLEFFVAFRDEELMRSTEGRRFRKGQIIINNSKSRKSHNQYLQTKVNSKNVTLHRDLFLSFCAPGIEIEKVNHINGDIYDMILINMEQSDKFHNILHAFRELGVGNGVKVKRIEINNNLNEKLFNSVTEASEDAQRHRVWASKSLLNKGYFVSKDENYYYVYNDSSYVPPKKIYYDTIGQEYKRVLIIKEDDKQHNFNNKFYHVSDAGDFVSKHGNLYYQMKPHRKGGYLCIFLIDDQGKRKQYKVHRVVLIVHLNGTTGRTDEHQDYTKLVVDHKNSIRDDNHLENLQFVTHEENIRLATGFKAVLMVHTAKISLEVYKQQKAQGNIIHDALFADVRSLDLFLNVTTQQLQKICSNNLVYCNYIFDYVTDDFYRNNKHIQRDIHFVKNRGIKLCNVINLSTQIVHNCNSMAEANTKLKLTTGRVSGFCSSKNPYSITQEENGTIYKMFYAIKTQDGRLLECSNRALNFGEEVLRIILTDKLNIIFKSHQIIQSNIDYEARYPCKYQR